MTKAWNKILIIEGRAFGDAVIKNGLINALGEKYPTVQIDILTKKEYKELFQGNIHIKNIYFFDLPRPAVKSLKLFSLVKVIVGLHKKKYDLCLDTVGDFRERFILKMISWKHTLSVNRPMGHPANWEIRRLFSPVTQMIEIPLTVVNIYEQHSYILHYFGVDRRLATEVKIKGRANVIGLHPFASRACKMWEWQKWEALIQKLLATTEMSLWIFCMPGQKQVLQTHLKNVIVNQRIKIKAVPLLDFMKLLGNVKLLIGLDSLSVHAAFAMGTPNIMLCGSNYYDLWKTPLTEVVSCGNECAFWPCLNVPKCEDGVDKYICMQNIQIEVVYKKARELLSEENNGEDSDI